MRASVWESVHLACVRACVYDELRNSWQTLHANVNRIRTSVFQKIVTLRSGYIQMIIKFHRPKPLTRQMLWLKTWYRLTKNLNRLTLFLSRSDRANRRMFVYGADAVFGSGFIVTLSAHWVVVEPYKGHSECSITASTVQECCPNGSTCE